MYSQKIQKLIDDNITVDLALNGQGSCYRKILARCNCFSKSFCYYGEPGFKVRFGNNSNLLIPFFMLERCYNAACANNYIYDTAIFQQEFYKQWSQHTCYTGVVGLIFYHAKLLNEITKNGNSTEYHLKRF